MVHRVISAAIAMVIVAVGLAGATAQASDTIVARQDSAREVNAGTVAIISGGINGTYIRIASDLAAVLDNGNTLRVLPIIGKGSVQNITDILYLYGIDIGIVQSDVLGYIRKEKLVPHIEQSIRYITKLYNEEVHVLAARGINRLQDLQGRKVNVDVAGSGTAMTASTLFGTLGVTIEATNFDQALALEKLRNGEIAAMVYVAGKPTELFRKIEDANSGLHFVPVPLTESLLPIYLPSTITHEDYPSLVADGQPTETVAVGAVMAVYNWNPKTDRYKRVAAFVDAFFDHFGEFLKPPRHPKWQEVNLAAQLPGWTRFRAADEWLASLDAATGSVTTAGSDRALKASFDEFFKFISETGGPGARPLDAQSRNALFERFVEWRSRPTASAPQRGPGATSPER
ncbi:MAG: TAXI family TRAP transporter solute-binding subunit [Rhodospirillales bacterium]|nr:TAXI family TRAP transporter solute-binding subunit [Rhodospirillales bacterium]